MNAVKNPLARAAARLAASVPPAAAALLAVAAAGTPAYPDGYSCPKTDLFADILANVPYRSMLPIYAGGAALGGPRGDLRIPASASRKTVCACHHDLGVPETGLAVGLWEPAYLLEFTREPGCFPVLGSVLPVPDRGIGSRGAGGGGAADVALYHAHLYSFPLFTMLNLYTDINCGRSEYLDLDLLYATEFDPSWYDESLAAAAAPDLPALADPDGVGACAAAAAAAYAGETRGGLPWCAGAWGFLYPLGGYVSAAGSPAENTSLLAARLLTLLHRRGQLRATWGDAAMCGGVRAPGFPGDAYRFSMLYPVPETGDTHAYGEPAEYWEGDARIPPGFHDAVYVVWRYRNCCLGAAEK